MKKSFTYMLLQYFLQGLLVLAPICITAWAIAAAFNFVDSLIPNLIHSVFPNAVEHTHIPGIGFIVMILIVLFVGYISPSYIFSKLVSGFEKLLARTPGVKFIYSTLKDFFEAFAGEKKKFTHNVVANIDDKDVWRVGFVTQEDMSEFGFKDYVAVYIPMAYSIAGNVYIVPKERIKPITNISAAQAMKFAVSGGVTAIEEEEERSL
jgi:uncharacterized membrane protein